MSAETEAERFWEDVGNDPIFALELLTKVTELANSSTLKTSLDQWLVDHRYFTDSETVLKTFTTLQSTSLIPWYGTYNVYAEGLEVRHTLELGSDGVWLDGTPIQDPSVVAGKLQWTADKNASSASLELRHVKPSGDAYTGPLVTGTITHGSVVLSVTGKIGVFSPAGVRGGESAVDARAFWEGRYVVQKLVGGQMVDSSPDLILERAGVVRYGAVIANPTFTRNALSWSSGAGSPNTSIGEIRFYLDDAGTASFYGRLVHDTDGVVDQRMNARGSKVEQTASGTALEILTTACVRGMVGESFEQGLNASGGAPPYTWSVGSKPAWLTLDATSGVLKGTPTAAGTFAIGIELTDSESTVAKRYLSLEVDAAPTDDAPSEQPYWTELLSLVISAGLGFLSGWALFCISRRAKRQDAKADSETREAVDAGRRVIAEPIATELRELCGGGDFDAVMYEESLRNADVVAQAARMAAEQDSRVSQLEAELAKQKAEIVRLNRALKAAKTVAETDAVHASLEEAKKTESKVEAEHNIAESRRKKEERRGRRAKRSAERHGD